MLTVVVPFAGVAGKTRLGAPEALRREVSLGDARRRARRLLSPSGTPVWPRRTRRGRTSRSRRVRGPCVIRGAGRVLRSRRLSRGSSRGRPRRERRSPVRRRDDLRALLAAAPDGIALAEASDGTTNALSLPYPDLSRRCTAPAARRVHRARGGARARGRLRHVPNLVDDVDTLDDLRRLQARSGPRTRACSRRRSPGVKVVVLSGGVGGARFVQGLVDAPTRATSPSSAMSATTSRCSGSTSRPISTRCSTRSRG